MIKDIVIKEAKTKAEYLAFVKFPYSLYKENPNWVPPLINDEIETIDPDLNPVYQNANASFFLAYQDEKIVGRIAAIVNWIEVKEIKKSKVRFGWFDVIDNINVTKSLIDCVIKFGKDHNLDSVEGPLGFSNLDKAGLLIKGYEEQNTMITLYNHPYYSEHLKKLGFNEAAKWVEYEIKIDDFESSPEKVKRFSKLIMKIQIGFLH